LAEAVIQSRQAKQVAARPVVGFGDEAQW